MSKQSAPSAELPSLQFQNSIHINIHFHVAKPGEKGREKNMQLYTFQCKSLILVRKRGRKHCFGGPLLEIELPEWKCGNNQGPEAGGVTPKLLLSVGAEPSWGHEVAAGASHMGKVGAGCRCYALARRSPHSWVWDNRYGEKTYGFSPMGDLPARQEGAASVPEKGGGLRGAGMIHSSIMDVGVSLGKPFPLLWAEA